MAKYEGFLFFVLMAIGTKSEGPDYQLQQFDYKVVPVIKKAEMFQEDKTLHKYVHKKVVIEGNLTEKGIEYQKISDYKP
jgi:hypothetical protein